MNYLGTDTSDVTIERWLHNQWVTTPHTLIGEGDATELDRLLHELSEKVQRGGHVRGFGKSVLRINELLPSGGNTPGSG